MEIVPPSVQAVGAVSKMTMRYADMLRSATLIVTLMLIATVATAKKGELETAQASALSWLALTDDQHFQSSWNAASTFFQEAISESDWVLSLTAARSSFGGLESRQLASATFSRTMPGAPDGRYVVFQFDTSFENKQAASETLSMIKDEDDVWKVAGYFIK